MIYRSPGCQSEGAGCRSLCALAALSVILQKVRVAASIIASFSLAGQHGNSICLVLDIVLNSAMRFHYNAINPQALIGGYDYEKSHQFLLSLLNKRC